MRTLIFLAGTAFLLTKASFANNPTAIPWPVGSTPAQMEFAKTLMNSYGDPCNDWGTFHAGIDIDENTEATNGDCVRSVINGYVQRFLPNTGGGYGIVISPTMESDNGWVYGHLCDPRLPNPEKPAGWEIGDQISTGAFIQLMDPNFTVHVHFSWVDVWNVGISLANPLDYLVPEPEGSSYWQFSPEALIPEFKFLILPEKWAYEWPTWWQNESEVAEDSIPRDFISGDVDVFFGVTLQGEAMGQVTSTGLAPERVYWELIREQVPEPVTLSQNYVYNFDCPLDKDDETSEKVFFNRLMTNLLNTDASMICLTNCGSEQGWEDLGIENIEENSWRTNRISGTYNQETSNPVLAMYPDGEYSIEVACYSHTNDPIPAPPDPDPAVAYTASIPCELHNFQPALREVSMLDLATDQVYYHAVWEPSTSGTSAELNVTVDQPVAAGTPVQVILVFTETMDTSSLSASLGPHSLGSETWSGSVVANDTWIGSVTMPTDGGRGFFTLSVSASDLDDNTLMDPEGEGSPSGNPDTHHVLSLGFGLDLLWEVSLPEPINGSVAVDDIDGDGFMELVVQTEEGTVHAYNHDGSVASGWPKGNNGYPSSYTSVHITPALGDINNDGIVDVIAGNRDGSMAWSGSTGNALPGWPFRVNGVEFAGRFFSYSSPVICDLNGDNALEVIACRQYYGGDLPETVFAINSSGNELWRANLNPGDGGEPVVGTPVVVDVTGDGNPEVLVCSSTMYPPNTDDPGADEHDGIVCDGRLYLLSGSNGAVLASSPVVGSWVFGSPVVADVDQDNNLEAVIACYNNSGAMVNAYVFSLPSLTQEHLWNIGVNYNGALGSPAIGDINCDSSLDIVLSSENYIHAWDGITKQPLSGFPIYIGPSSYVRHGVSLADIDGDGFQEILFCTRSNGKLFALNHDGSICGGFPIQIGSSSNSQPAIEDINRDGRLEIIVADRDAGAIRVYQAGEGTWPSCNTWSQYQHDARHTGMFGADYTIPAPPSDFDGTYTLNGQVFTAELSWTLSVNDPYNPNALPPADVVSYRIYRKIPPNDLVLAGTVNAGTDSYSDIIRFTGITPAVVAYFARAWDGTNESLPCAVLKFILSSNDNIALNSRIREVITSAIVESGSSATLNNTGSRLESTLGNCRVLTDGNHDTVYMPSSSAECVEIDLGAVFTVTDVAIIRSDLSLMESMRLELSTDGTIFRAVDSGRARHARVYGAGGASEIEVMGTPVEGASIPIEIVREEQGFFRITSAEEGTPMTVSVFDLAGRRVWDGASSSGEVLWNRRTSSGTPVPTGVYLLLIETDGLEPVTSRVVVR